MNGRRLILPAAAILSSWSAACFAGEETPRGLLMRCSIDDREAVRSAGGTLVAAEHSDGITFEPGCVGNAVRLNGTYVYRDEGNLDKSEQIIFPGSKFDFTDAEDDGGRFEFWLKFNEDPHLFEKRRSNRFILKGDLPRNLHTPKYRWSLSIEMYGSKPFVAFEFPVTNRDMGDRFLVYSSTWNERWSRWENWKKDEWHLLTIAWKRNRGEDKAQLWLYIDGVNEKFRTCADADGTLPPAGSVTQVRLGNWGRQAIDISVDEFTSWSSTASWTPPESRKDSGPPSVPQGLTAKAASGSQIDLSWNPSTDDNAPVIYRVFRDGSAIATTGAPHFSDKGLAPGASHSYAVSAFDPAGKESARSAAARGRTAGEGR